MQQVIFIYVYIVYIIGIQFCSYILLWDIAQTELLFYNSGTNKFKRKTQEERFLLSQESKTINTNAHKKPNFKHIKQVIHHVGYEYVLKLTADYNWQLTVAYTPVPTDALIPGSPQSNAYAYHWYQIEN